MELDQMTQPGPGLCGSDRELFQRVWRRVMPEDQLNSPIEVLPPPEPAPGAPARIEPPTLAAEQPQVRDPRLCLGPESAEAGEALQGFILGELRSRQGYLALARRAPASARRTLTALADQELRHAKQLSAAYFLLSGVRYWPQEPRVPHTGVNYLKVLRDYFLAKRRTTAAYQAAAEGTGDPCLRELYTTLSDQEWNQAQRIRALVEQM